MSDFLNNLLGAQGCQVDGSMGMNPVNQLVDHFLEGINAISGSDMMSQIGGQSTFFYDESVMNDPENAYVANMQSSMVSFLCNLSIFMCVV